jgi:ABC-type phosphate/phosphonate transport system substrate-binding protein
MPRRYPCVLSVCRAGLLAWAVVLGSAGAADMDLSESAQPLQLIVMDPLAKELACACVLGYGQRDYRKLAARLGAALDRKVSLEFSDDLVDSFEWTAPDQEIVIIGDRSLVTHGARAAGRKFQPVCALTDLEGNTSLPALFVARRNDPVNELKQVEGRPLLFGVADGDERHASALAALRASGVSPPDVPGKRMSPSEAALDVLDSKAELPPVAVIPAYALRLLEGCGSVTPGALKIIGRTEPAPFITVFVADDIAADKRRRIVEALVEMKRDAAMLKVMESRDGFVPLPSPRAVGQRADWPDWRGPNRDGRVQQLPARLPDTARILWKKAAMNGGLAGLSVSDDRLVLAERDFGDEYDVYRCLHAGHGELLWRLEFPARGTLDYGQSPRATPVIHEGRAYLLGAFGDLRCVDIMNGKVLWQRHLLRDFGAELPTWGMCATPLIVDDLVILNPGGPKASLAALDRVCGDTRWTAPGHPAAYAAFICGEFGGRRQIVGYDQESLGGWDPTTGERLWQLVPQAKGDFNVPTPVAVDGGLIVSTENNGTRFYRFDTAGRIDPQPAGEYADLAPDTTTPVATAGRIFGSHLGLHALQVGGGLRPVWCYENDPVGDYATLVADSERVLVITLAGELILLDARADRCTIVSRLKVFEDDVEVYAHPALVGTRLYIRGGFSVLCVDLGPDKP